MNFRSLTLLLCCGLVSWMGCNSRTTDPGKSTDTADVPTTGTPDNPQPSEPAKPFDRDQEIASANALMRAGKPEQAATVLQRVLLTDPNDVEVLFRLANVRAEQGDLRGAVTLLESIPENHPEAGLPALGRAADFCMQLRRYDDAEKRYRKIVELRPDAAIAHRQLAFLYNRQGRRQEAAEHIRTLCRLGNVRQDELHALMIVSNAIFDDPSEVTRAPGERAYLPIGPGASARMLSTAMHYQDAVAALDKYVATENPKASIVALFGRLAIEAQDEDRFLWWLDQTDQGVRKFSDYWAAIGTYLVGKHRYAEAVRALSEAIDRDPTDVNAMRLINQALTAMGKTDEADQWLERYGVVREITIASNSIGETKTPDPDLFTTVADGLDKINRPLEAITWRIFGAFHRQASKGEIEKLNAARKQLLNSKEAFPDRKERLCGIKLEDYPLPKIDVPEQAVTSHPRDRTVDLASLPQPKFSNVASAIGLVHNYQVASKPQPYRFALYQSLGGGAAVLDYDLDGLVDFYLAQGGSEPPQLVGKISNLFYRLVGDRLVDVTAKTGTEDYRYSIGITTGDWNQDGFGDLVVADIGNIVLLINNGDGTFRRQPFDADPDYESLPSSVAMGDLSGDAIPDIFTVHYVEDKTMINKPGVGDDGLIQIISPSTFIPGVDRVTVNDGSGGMTTRKVSETKKARSTGLGVVIADWDGQPGNEVFVGNDLRPNHLWALSGDKDGWVDTAPLTGCAYGHGGTSTASMGIAVADYDNSGSLDIHVTNFYLEPVSLFMNEGGMFEDRCIQYKLDRVSSSVLGFGCQAIDYNNDGIRDLAVSNGHIEKSPGEDLEQPPQFFVNFGSEFQLADVDDDSGYFSDKYLGRGMARVDVNRDGRSDMLITHMGTPTAVLLNQTQTDNHWLGVQLVGTESERDAIGAKVEIRAGDHIWTGWLVGGDGYLCRNEAVIPFGLGQAAEIDSITVTWPRGDQQTFNQVEVDQRIMLIENQPEVFSVSNE